MFIKLNRFKTLVNKALAAFSPASLFASGEQGVWYDPSDITTMFQDSAGTTPVTAVEQPVGLLLDKSKGLVLGSELVTNGGPFTTTTGWTAASGTPPLGTLSVSSGKLRNTASSGNFPYATFNFTTVVGARYRFSARGYHISGVDSSFIQKAEGTSGIIGFSATSPITLGSGTTITAFFVATTTTTQIQLVSTNGNVVVDWDNISVKELAGNHATQSINTKRPVLSARYNLLARTEEFSSGLWQTYVGGSKTGTDVAVAPDGTTTADSIRLTSAGTNSNVYQQINSFVTPATSYTFSCYVKRNAGSNQIFQLFNNLQGVEVASGNLIATDTWQRFTHTSSSPAGSGLMLVGIIGNTSGTQSDLLVWGAQLIATNSLLSNAYQRVVTGTRGTSTASGTSDYDTNPTNFPPYLKFDGVDDAMATSSINFTATDKMSVFAGVRKASDSAQGTFIETSAQSTAPSFFGSFAVFSPSASGVASYQPFFRGDVGRAFETLSSYAAPITNVLAVQMSNQLATDGDAISSRINGVAITPTEVSSITDAGNFGNYPLYVGARDNGTSLFFNGNLYSLIIRGSASTATQITDTETYVNSKTKAY